MAHNIDKPIQVGLLGCGTVGGGVARILNGQKDLIQSRLGAQLRLAKVADIDKTAVEGLGLAEGVFTSDARAVALDPDIPIVIELIGGEGVAKELVLEALLAGKSVVTANKALIAGATREIREAAEKGGGDFYFEASVGGCMPVIKTLRESLAGNEILSAHGILNGTCNYILSKITLEGMAYEEALALAQKEGFAEADPFLDVSGMDTVHKLALVMALSYGCKVDYRDIYVEGISHITPMDIQIAAEFGYCIKLLAISKNLGKAVEGRVHPTMIPKDNLLSSVNGAMNAVQVTGHATGEMVLYGQGAGDMPTASAVVGDVVDISRNLICGCPGRVPGFSFQPDYTSGGELLPISEIQTRYYMRFAAQDKPGVLSKISGVLGDFDISIQSVHQKGRQSEGAVPIVLLTHEAREADVQSALARINKLDVVSGEPVLIRIEDNEEDAV